MKLFLKAGESAIVLLLLCGASLPPHIPNIRVVGINHGEVAVVSSDGTIHDLTSDGEKKYKPVWSPDGSMIAYLETTPLSLAMGRLVVNARERLGGGQSLGPPSGDPASNTDMPYIETLQWGGTKKVLLGGSINPSTVEYIECNIGKPMAANDFMADGFQVAYSPDGNHLAIVSGTVHWALGDAPQPILTIDEKSVASLAGRQVKFLSPPAWSPDNASLAVVIGGQNSQQPTGFVRRMEGTETRLPLPSGASPELTWDRDGSLYAIVDGVSPGSPARAYWVKSTAGQLQSLEAKAIPAMSTAAENRATIRSIQARGLKDVDVWNANASPSVNASDARFFE